jgi:hypothetical protein
MNYEINFKDVFALFVTKTIIKDVFALFVTKTIFEWSEWFLEFFLN